MHLDEIEIARIEAIEVYEEKVWAAARMYANNGFKIVPVRPGTKVLAPGFGYWNATDDVQRVNKWWSEKYAGFGIGICAGPGSVAVIDIDSKNGKDGYYTFRNMFDMDAEALPGVMARTPNGGIHVFYEWFDGAQSKSNCPGLGIDTRGGNLVKGVAQSTGYVLAWPSKNEDGLEYRWINVGEVTECPAFLMESIRKTVSIQVKKAVGSDIGRGNEFLDREDDLTPVQLKGLIDEIDPNFLGYDEWLKVGMAIKTYFPGKEGLEFFDEWSRRGQRYREGECAKRWPGFTGNAVRQGTLHMYVKACRAGIAPSEYINSAARDASTQDEAITAIVEAMNQEFAVVTLGSKARIMRKRQRHNKWSSSHSFVNRSDFLMLMENRPVVTLKNGKFVNTNHGMVWLSDPRRKDYDNGIIMDPGKPREYNKSFNMWEGFSVDPEPGCWDLYEQHIRQIICSGDKELAEWVLDWMAYGVQFPGKQPGTAIVMRGGEGTGKGTFAQMYGELFGPHFKHVTDAEHLVGRFNMHLADAVLVFADEVVYGGERKAAGKLKGLVTENTINLEPKGIDPVPVKNCIKLIVASNEEWVIPTGPTARRWLCLDVSKKVMQNSDYFKKLNDQMRKQGGLQALMHDLLNRKITRNIHTAPDTKMRVEQKELYASTSSVQRWWRIMLENGHVRVPLTSPIMPGEEDKWPEGMRTTATAMYEAYERWCIERRYKIETLGVFSKHVDELGMIRKKIKGNRLLEFDSYLAHVRAFETLVGHSIHDEEYEDGNEEQ